MLLQHPAGPCALRPGLQPPTRGGLWGAGSTCWRPALSTDCSPLQPPTRRSHRWPCPRSRWRLGAATRSRCTLGSKHRLCRGHAATPSWPSQRARGTHLGRRPPALLAPRTNLSSKSSLGRRSETQLRGEKSPSLPFILLLGAVLAQPLLPAPAHRLPPPRGREAAASGSAPAGPGAAPCPSHRQPQPGAEHPSCLPTGCSPWVPPAPQASH